MQHIRNKDSKIELVLRKALWDQGIRYRKNYPKIPGKPDIALTKYKIAIFCDSEYFHGKNWDTLSERIRRGNNSEFWLKKISDNIRRDQIVNEQLEALGWKVLRFWGNDILKDLDSCLTKINDEINLKK